MKWARSGLGRCSPSVSGEGHEGNIEPRPAKQSHDRDRGQDRPNAIEDHRRDQVNGGSEGDCEDDRPDDGDPDGYLEMTRRVASNSRDQCSNSLVGAGGDQQYRGHSGAEEGDIERPELDTREIAKQRLEGKDQEKRKEDLDPGKCRTKTFQDGAELVVDLVAIFFSRCLICRAHATRV